MKLGLIYNNKTNQIYNHRSILKIVLNPILRLLFKAQIGTSVKESKLINGKCEIIGISLIESDTRKTKFGYSFKKVAEFYGCEVEDISILKQRRLF